MKIPPGTAGERVSYRETPRHPGTMSRIPVPDFRTSRLIVSCQAWPGDPLDDVEVMRRLARAAVANGAGGIRANGPADIRAIRQDTDLPIIGIQKRFFDGDVRITPDFASARELAAAGASIIALDCTARPPLAGEPWREILRRIHDELRLPVMADIATLEEGIEAAAAGADLIGTTLCGYTPATRHLQGIPWELLEQLLAAVDLPILLEGNVGRPEQARRAIERGAAAVVVGTAITRPGELTRRFAEAVAAADANVWALGVDIGGTTIRAAMVDSAGNITCATQMPTGAGGRAAIRHSLHRAIRQVMNNGQARNLVPAGIGVASAGVIDVHRGIVTAAGNHLPESSGFDLRRDLEAAFGLPVCVENDAHAAALGELRFGAGRQWHNFAVITIGTGLGGGVVLDGQLVRGTHGFAGGFGHHSICFNGPLCPCGRRGCLETYVSAPALLRAYAAHGGDAGSLTAAEVALLAGQGDAAAQAALHGMAEYLAEGLANLWNCLDPEAILLAGGVAQTPGWAELVQNEMMARLMFAGRRHTVVAVARASLFAGVQGAVVPVQDAVATTTFRKI